MWNPSQARAHRQGRRLAYRRAGILVEVRLDEGQAAVFGAVEYGDRVAALAGNDHRLVVGADQHVLGLAHAGDIVDAVEPGLRVRKVVAVFGCIGIAIERGQRAVFQVHGVDVGAVGAHRDVGRRKQSVAGQVDVAIGLDECKTRVGGAASNRRRAVPPNRCPRKSPEYGDRHWSRRYRPARSGPDCHRGWANRAATSSGTRSTARSWYCGGKTPGGRCRWRPRIRARRPAQRRRRWAA